VSTSRERGNDWLPSSQVRVAFSVNGRPVRVEARVPDLPVRLDQLLPALRSIDNALIDAAVAGHEQKGERISCAKGCSACCRTQPVPVTPPEAYALARLVDALPEPRRSAVRAAFAAAVEQVRAAGLYHTYMQRDPAMTREAAIATVRRYMALAIACPFLVNEACSIYADRPFVCRQYLVTSPPALCDHPLDNAVKPIATPAPFASAMLMVTQGVSERPQHTVPLVLALEQAAANRDEMERTHDAKAVFGQVIDALKRG
jgi:Fe-S-cluster containining protein